MLVGWSSTGGQNKGQSQGQNKGQSQDQNRGQSRGQNKGQSSSAGKLLAISRDGPWDEWFARTNFVVTPLYLCLCVWTRYA